jgi:hypothetical protein
VGNGKEAALTGNVAPLAGDMKNGLPVTPKAAPVVSAGTDSEQIFDVLHRNDLNVCVDPAASFAVKDVWAEAEVISPAAMMTASNNFFIMEMSSLVDQCGDVDDVATHGEIELAVGSAGDAWRRRSDLPGKRHAAENIEADIVAANAVRVRRRRK